MSLATFAQRTSLCYICGILEKATFKAVLELRVLRFIFISHLSWVSFSNAQTLLPAQHSLWMRTSDIRQVASSLPHLFAPWKGDEGGEAVMKVWCPRGWNSMGFPHTGSNPAHSKFFHFLSVSVYTTPQNVPALVLNPETCLFPVSPRLEEDGVFDFGFKKAKIMI